MGILSALVTLPRQSLSLIYFCILSIKLVLGKYEVLDSYLLDEWMNEQMNQRKIPADAGVYSVEAISPSRF